MKTNEAGLDLIKKYEGLSLEAYLCPAGKWTIGFGHTGDVKQGDKITEHQANVILGLDLERFERQVEILAPNTNENEFSAFVSFVYNLGAHALQRSNLLRLFLTGDKTAAAAEFMKWTYAAGHVLPGLVKRRAAEKALFLTPVADP